VSWLLNEAAFSLRALGRLEEALAPMHAGAEMAAQRKDWMNAAIAYGNLSELGHTLGRTDEAVANARLALDLAERSGDASLRILESTTLADVLHQNGETEDAGRFFAEAEALQAESQPQFPLLYSGGGFRYCDLLLARAERTAWGAGTGSHSRVHLEAQAGTAEALANCESVARRGQKMFEWRVPSDPLLDIALDYLTLARCALYADLLRGLTPGPEARSQAEQSLDRLRAAGRQDYIPRTLLTRAWVRQAAGDPNGARADLDEAERIAARGSMRLHLADCALYRARLFRDRAALAEARRLIDACGYRRRLPELEDAERAAADWPDPSNA
jgi:tetratricopeptide (TPR) repeat protein